MVSAHKVVGDMAEAGLLRMIGTVAVILPAVALGRGVSRRENPELSSGKTLFSAATVLNSPCISLSLSGIFAARSSDSE